MAGPAEVGRGEAREAPASLRDVQQQVSLALEHLRAAADRVRELTEENEALRREVRELRERLAQAEGEHRPSRDPNVLA